MAFKLLTAVTVLIFAFTIAHVGLPTPLGLAIKAGIAVIPFGDKAIHFVLLTVLAYLLGRSCQGHRSNIWGWRLLTSSLALGLCITLEELSQAFIPSRNFEIMDLVCNYAGIYVGGLLLGFAKLKHSDNVKHYRSETLPV